MASEIQNKLEVGNLRDITTYQAGALQASAHRSLRLLCDKVLSSYGLTKVQWLIIGLTLDAGRPGIRLGDISRQLDLSAKSLANIIATLEKHKMIARLGKTKTGSRQLVATHPTFAQDCPEIERILRTALRDAIYSTITPMEFRVYLKVLYHLSRLQPNG